MRDERKLKAGCGIVLRSPREARSWLFISRHEEIIDVLGRETGVLLVLTK